MLSLPWCVCVKVKNYVKLLQMFTRFFQQQFAQSSFELFRIHIPRFYQDIFRKRSKLNDKKVFFQPHAVHWVLALN